MNWRDKRSWHILGIFLTVAWLTFVAVRSGGDPEDPLFRYIFTVPLAGWIVLLVATRWLERKSGSDDDEADD